MREKIFEMLGDELNRRRRALNDNRLAIAKLAREQKRLKLEWRDINDFLWELKKK